MDEEITDEMVWDINREKSYDGTGTYSACYTIYTGTF